MSRGKKHLATKRTAPNPEVFANMPDLAGAHPLSKRYEVILKDDPTVLDPNVLKAAREGKSVDLLKTIALYSNNQSIVLALKKNEILSEEEYVASRSEFFKEYFLANPDFDQHDHWLMSDLHQVIDRSDYSSSVRPLFKSLLANSTSGNVLSKVIASQELTDEVLRPYMPRLIANPKSEHIWRSGFLGYQRKYQKPSPLMNSIFLQFISTKEWDDQRAYNVIKELLSFHSLEIPDDVWSNLVDIFRQSGKERVRDIDYLLMVIQNQKIPASVLHRISINDKYPINVRVAAANHHKHPTKF